MDAPKGEAQIIFGYYASKNPLYCEFFYRVLICLVTNLATLFLMENIYGNHPKDSLILF